MNKGRIIQVIGSVFDIEFAGERVPGIYHAVTVAGKVEDRQIKLVGEVQQHLGGGRVRAVALGSTLGLRRGMEVIDTGEPLQVPVGVETLGRVFNLLGEPVDGKGKGTGFVFERFGPTALRWALDAALDLYADRDAWRLVVANAMAKNFSWEVQARRYVELYDWVAR